MTMRKKMYISRICTVICMVVLLLNGCVKTQESRGYITAPNVKIDRIKIGVTDKKDVMYLLGSPSSVSTFSQDIWYYIGLKMETNAYTASNVVDQDILIITFNDTGIVEDVTKRGAEDRRNIEISEDFTPTDGNTMGLAEQLLGNLGRYNGAQ